MFVIVLAALWLFCMMHVADHVPNVTAVEYTWFAWTLRIDASDPVCIDYDSEWGADETTRIRVKACELPTVQVAVWRGGAL